MGTVLGLRIRARTAVAITCPWGYSLGSAVFRVNLRGPDGALHSLALKQHAEHLASARDSLSGAWHGPRCIKDPSEGHKRMTSELDQDSTMNLSLAAYTEWQGRLVGEVAPMPKLELEQRDLPRFALRAGLPVSATDKITDPIPGSSTEV